MKTTNPVGVSMPVALGIWELCLQESMLTRRETL
jgi:hypothetical protein